MKYIFLCLLLALLGCTTSPQTNQTKGELRKIELTEDGECFLDGQAVQIENLSTLLNPTDQVEIIPNDKTLHKVIVSVMDEVAEANVKHMSFHQSE